MSDPQTRPNPLLEIACFDEESAMVAAKAGADRIELCRDYLSGGLSPEITVLERLKSELNIPIFVMIRPHAQGFCYQHDEFETMKSTLASLKSCGADGFVFGVLTPASEEQCETPRSWIDVPRNTELVRLAGGLPCTFHRAFDLIPESEWTNALAEIVDCGFSSILTSGGPSGTQATQCVAQLANLVDWQSQYPAAQRDSATRIPQIIVGGGVRASNIDSLSSAIGASAFHSAALSSPGASICPVEVSSMKQKLHIRGR